MGLDTTAYETATPLFGHPDHPCGDEDGDYCYEAGHREVFTYSDLHARARGASRRAARRGGMEHQADVAGILPAWRRDRAHIDKLRWPQSVP